MQNLTLKQLRYFEALRQQGHFGRAAEVCAISQPALSVQIKDMEGSLGSALFERGPRGVRLTAFGEDVAERVHGILRAVDELGEMALAARDGLSGRLRIGVIPTIAPYLLPTLIGRLGTAFPGLDVHVRETITPRLIEELADGRLDTAIVALPVSEPAFTEVALFSEDLVLVRPLADADKPVPELQALRDIRLLLLEEGHCFRDQALALCGTAPRAPGAGATSEAGSRGASPRNGGLDGSSLSTLVQMVGAGLGVTLIPQMAVEVETRSAPVCVSSLPAPRPTRQVGMIWRKSSPLLRQLQGIANVVRDAAMARPAPG